MISRPLRIGEGKLLLPVLAYSCTMRKAAEGRPHSKTLARLPRLPCTRSVLECGRPSAALPVARPKCAQLTEIAIDKRPPFPPHLNLTNPHPSLGQYHRNLAPGRIRLPEKIKEGRLVHSPRYPLDDVALGIG